MFFSTYVAGVSSSDNICQIAVIERKKNLARLRSLHEFRKQNESPTWFLQPLLTRSEKIFRKVKRVGVAVDHEQLGFLQVPVDGALNPAQVREHLAWEYAQFVPESKAEEFISDGHLLATAGEAPVSGAVIVGVPKEYIGKVQGEIEANRFGCGTIDASLFAAQTSAMISHPELLQGQHAIAGIFQRQLVVGIFIDGRLASCATHPLTSQGDILVGLQRAFEDRQVATLCVYGNAAGGPIMGKLRAAFPANVVLLNSLKGLDLGFERGVMQQFIGREHLFAAAIGIALKDS